MIFAILLYYYQTISSGNYDKAFLRDYAVVESLNAGLSVQDTQKVLYTIDHEDKSWIPTMVHYNDGAQGCNSVGLVQIRDCSHPDVSYEQATNPIFAVNFLIDNIDKCNTMWKNTCGMFK